MTIDEKDILKIPGIGVAFSIVLFTTLGMGSDSMWKYLLCGGFMGMLMEFMRMYFVRDDSDDE